MSKYTIEYLPIGDVSLNEANPRFIKDDSFKKLVDSLRDCPDLFHARPLLCNKDRTILGGNMRYRAAMELNYQEVPVIIMENLTEEQEREVVIKDNGGFGEWDFDELANSWSDLPLSDWGISLPEEWGKEPEVEPAAEEGYNDALPPEPKTVHGDLYELNGHRLHCGDSLNSLDIDKLMNGKAPAMVFTDPPFDMDYENMLSVFGYYPDLFQVWVLDDNSAVRLAADNIDCLFTVMVYVAKNSLLTNNRQPIRVHCLMPVFNFRNAHTDLENYTTVFEYGRNLSFVAQTGASHSKPIQLFDSTLRNWLKEGDIVADWFAHSGAVLIAAEQENRLCYSQELEPKYCDLIVRRWVKFMKDNNRAFAVKRNGLLLTEEELNEF